MWRSMRMLSELFSVAFAGVGGRVQSRLMDASTRSADLAMMHGYLKLRRSDLLGKLDGLGEYEVRRPLTASGTNLLGAR